MRNGQFIMACRLFQKSQASIAILKREFPLSYILKRNRVELVQMQLDNSFITDPNMGDIEFLSSGVDDSYREG